MKCWFGTVVAVRPRPPDDLYEYDVRFISPEKKNRKDPIGCVFQSTEQISLHTPISAWADEKTMTVRVQGIDRDLVLTRDRKRNDLYYRHK